MALQSSSANEPIPVGSPTCLQKSFSFAHAPRIRGVGGRQGTVENCQALFFSLQNSFEFDASLVRTMFPVQCVDIIAASIHLTSLLVFDSFIHSSNFFISPTTTDGSRKKVIWNKGGDGIKMYGKLVEQPMFALLVEAY